MRPVFIILLFVALPFPVIGEHMIVGVEDRMEIVKGGVVSAGRVSLLNNASLGDKVGVSFGELGTSQVLYDRLGFGVVGMHEDEVHVPGAHSINSNSVVVEYKVLTDGLEFGYYSAVILVDDGHGVREFPVMIRIVDEERGGFVQRLFGFFGENSGFLLAGVGVVSLFSLVAFTILYWNENRRHGRATR